jgi:hypothetical protein
MNDARASHINAKQGTIKNVNLAKLDTKSCGCVYSVRQEEGGERRR